MEFRHPLNLIASDLDGLRRAVQADPGLARDLAAGEIPYGEQHGRELQDIARSVHGDTTAESCGYRGDRCFIVRLAAGAIHADLFIHGAEACGVRLDLSRGDARLATAEPEVPCVSTSTYYGVLTKDAAVGLVNTVSRAAPLIAVAETLRGGVFELYDADERPSTAVRAGSIAPPRSIATWSPGSADESLVDPWTASSPNVDRLPASGL